MQIALELTRALPVISPSWGWVDQNVESLTVSKMAKSQYPFGRTFFVSYNTAASRVVCTIFPGE